MIIEGDGAAARSGFPGSPARRRIVAVVAAALAIVALGLFVARDAIERTTLTWRLQHALAGTVTIGALRHAGGETVLDDVALATADRSIAFDASELRLRSDGGTLRVRARAPHLQLVADAVTADDAQRLRAAIAAAGGGTVTASLADGTLRIARSDGDRALQATAIAGSVRVEGALRDADVTLQLGEGASAAPVRVRSDPVRGGIAVTADAVPLASLDALLPSDGAQFDAGTARRVDLRINGGPHGTFALQDGRVRIGGHEIAALAGDVTVTPRGLGSLLLSGAVGGLPFTASGEIDDVHDWSTLLAQGTRDARMLARMFDEIAAQPNLKWINVDTTAPGVVFGQYQMTSKDPAAKPPGSGPDIPHVVQLIAVDPKEPTLRFDTAIAGDHVISSGERTSQLAIRTHAVAGVNGDYFDIGRTYEPQGMLVRSGTLVRGPTDRIALTIDRANDVTFNEFRLDGHARYGGVDVPVTQLNTWPAGDATVITPDYGRVLRASPGVTFAALAPLGGDRYRVTEVRAANAEIPVTYGLAIGPKVHARAPRRGEIVTLRYALDPPVHDVVAGIGGGPLLLKNGEWYEDRHAPAPDERDVQWPVVALGVRSDKTLLFVAVDGRHPERSIGMTRPEFAEILKSFGVTDAMALDSGGSVTMVSRAPGHADVTVRNVPSDDSAERYISDALFVYSSAPPPALVAPVAAGPTAAAAAAPR